MKPLEKNKLVRSFCAFHFAAGKTGCRRNFFTTGKLVKHLGLNVGLPIAGMLAFGLPTAQAANKALSTTPTSGNFGDINWANGSTTPSATKDSAAASGDALYFGASSITALTNDLTGASFAGFTFNSGAATFTIGGNDFTLTSALTNNSTATQVINNNITFGSQQSIVSNTGSITLGGILSGTGFGITKTGTGLLTLSGANLFTGASTITGILNANNNSALGSGGVTINAATGNQLQLGSGVNLSNALTIAGGGAVAQGALFVPTGNAIYSGTINVTGVPQAGGVFATGGPTSVLSIAGNNTITAAAGVPITVRNGIVKYTGSQSYTTGTTLANVNAAIQFGQITSMPAAGAVSIASGASAFFNVGGTGEFTTATSGNGSIGALLAGTGGQGAAFTAATGSSIGLDTTNAAGTATYAGAFTTTNNVGLIKLGTGTLALTNGGTFAGVGGYGGFPLIARQGTLLLNGGTFTVTGEAVVGGLFGTANGDAGLNARLQVDSGALNISGYLSVGRGNGIGGVSSDLVVNNAATVGAANFSGGFNGGNAANLPKGSITLNNTSALTITSGGAFNLGESAGSNITVTLNNSSTLTSLGAGGKFIGNGGTGVLTLNNSSTANLGIGPTTGTGAGFIIGNTGGNGTLNLNGTANVSFAGLLNVGFNTGTGAVNVNGGTLAVTGEMRVGAYDTGNTATPTATGTFTQTGGTATVSAPTLARGSGSLNNINGTATISGGTLTSTNDVIVGYAGSGTGSLTVSGGTLNVGTTTGKILFLGDYDTVKGQVTVSSGTMKLNTSSSIYFGAFTGATNSAANSFTLNGGNVTYYSDNGTTVGGTGTLNLQASGTATPTNTFNLNGGTLTVPQIVSGVTTGTRLFNFNGGTLRAAGNSAAFMASGVASTANVRNGGAVVDTNGFAITIGQALVHSTVGGDNATDGGLTKLGVGTLSLTGVNTYTGATTVNAGTLDLGGSTTTGSIDPGSVLALGGGALAYTRTGTNTQTFAGTAINSGGAGITDAVSTNTLALGAITRNPGGTVNFTGPGAITTTTANTSNGILGGWATYGLNDWATSAGTGAAAGNVIAYSGYTTYNNVSGLSTGPNGGAGVNSTTDLTDDGNGYDGTYTTSIALNSLRFNASAGDGNFGVVNGNNVTLTSGGILVTNNVGAKYQRIGFLNGNFNAGEGQGGITLAAPGDLVINQNNSGTGHLEIYSAIYGTGVNLVKSGAGFLDLRGLAASYSGSTTINAGTLQVSGGDDRLPTTTALTMNGGTLNLAGVNQTVASLSGNATAVVDHSGSNSILTVNQSPNTTFAGVIKNTSGTLGLTKSGIGALIVSGANTYTGVTQVTGGALLVNGSTVGGSAVTVSNGGTLLGGTGTVAGPVSVGGGGAAITAATRGSSGMVVAANVGRLNTGSLTLTTGSVFHFDVLNAAGTAGTSYDQIAITGALSLGNATLEGSLAPGLTFPAGQTLLLLNNDAADAISGTFNGIAQGDTVLLDGYSFMASYIGGDGNDFTLTPVPEPATWVAGMLIVGTLGFRQRRKLASWIKPSAKWAA